MKNKLHGICNKMHQIEKTIAAGPNEQITTEDIEGLTKWREIFGSDHKAVFVFTYKIDNIDVDFDGKEVFHFDSNRYVFFCVKLDDYRKFMKPRSPKWHTVTLPAEKFRQCSIQLSDYIS